MSSESHIPTELYAIRLETFFKPAVTYQEDEEESDPVIRYPNPGSYSELELQLLISRITVRVSRRIRMASVHFYRNIVDSRINNHLLIYIKSGNNIVIPHPSDLSNLPTGYVHSKDATQVGSEPLTLKQLSRLVRYCETNYREYGVVAGNPIHTDIGVIPDWWIQSIIKSIDLDWLSENIESHHNYNYDLPVIVRGQYCLMIQMNSPTMLLDLFNSIGGIVAEILTDLYKRGCLSYQLPDMNIHPSGLYILNWSHPLILDRTKLIERQRNYGKSYVPVASYIVGASRHSNSNALIDYNHSYLVSDGNRDSILQMLNSL